LTREQHDLLVDMSTNIAVQKSENTGKVLIMLNDSSLSMNGTPFDTLVGALVALGDVLFYEGGATCNMFEHVHNLFYNDRLTAHQNPR
jgi:hypothetical protein